MRGLRRDVGLHGNVLLLNSRQFPTVFTASINNGSIEPIGVDAPQVSGKKSRENGWHMVGISTTRLMTVLTLTFSPSCCHPETLASNSSACLAHVITYGNN